MSEAIFRRPGIVLVAIIWSFFSIGNIWVAFQGISSSIEGWALISDPLTHEWLKTVIPIELGFFVAILIAALFQIVSIPGVPAGKSWSFKLALGAPIAIGILSLTLGLLYASAPPEFSELQSSRVILVFLFAVFQMFSAFIFWMYMKRPEAKMFLEMKKKQSTAEKNS